MPASWSRPLCGSMQDSRSRYAGRGFPLFFFASRRVHHPLQNICWLFILRPSFCLGSLARSNNAANDLPSVFHICYQTAIRGQQLDDKWRREARNSLGMKPVMNKFLAYAAVVVSHSSLRPSSGPRKTRAEIRAMTRTRISFVLTSTHSSKCQCFDEPMYPNEPNAWMIVFTYLGSLEFLLEGNFQLRLHH